MYRVQENRLTMIEAVCSFLTERSEIFAGIVEFVEHSNKLSELKNAIAAKEDQRVNVKKGKTELKEKTRARVSKLALTVAGALFAYAKKSDNTELREKSNFTPSKLGRMRDSELPITLKTIRDLAVENLDSLTPFGINQSTIEQYEARIASYSGALGNKESSGAAKAGAARSLRSLFDETSSVLKSIDRLMERYVEENPEFYNGYKAARNIVVAGIRHRKDEQKPQGQPSPPQASQ